MAHEKKTSFATVEIRHYPCVLSDNPAALSGPSIELGWDYMESQQAESNNESVKRLSIFEKERVGKRRSDCYLSQRKRERMLLRANYSKTDLAYAMQLKKSVQRGRSVSNLLQSPSTRVIWMVRAAKREKRLARAAKNLQRLQGDTFFFSHEEIYGKGT